MHLDLDLYSLSLRRLVPRDELVRLIHEHLLEVCAGCREEHAVDEHPVVEEGRAPAFAPAAASGTAAASGPELATDTVRGAGEPAPVPMPADPHHVGEEHLESRLRLLERIRSQRDLDRRQLRQLLQIPPEGWTEAVETSRTRFRTRSFAERLLEESRQCAADQPELALRLAALVPVVLRWTPGAAGTEWEAELQVRSVAWQANALRAAGAREAAEERFGELDLERLFEARTWTAAETADLLSALRADQGRKQEADRLRSYATILFEQLGDAEPDPH